MTSNSLPDKPPAKSFRKQLATIGGTGLLLLIGISVVISNFGTRSQPIEKSTPKALPVATLAVRKVDTYQVLRNYTGEVAAQRASELGFERSGKLVWFGVDRGDRVTSGRAIAKIDTRKLQVQRARLLAQKAQALAVLAELENGARPEDIAAARAEVNNLKNQLELEKIKAERRSSLYTQGAISREDLDEITYISRALNDRLNIAQSSLEELLNGTRPEQIAAQKAVVRQLDASIAELDVDIDKSTIRAPFSGTIAAREVDEGTTVQAGQSVVRLVEDGALEVQIGVPTQILSLLEIGSKQKVEIEERTYQAIVVSFLPEIDPATRTRSVILKITENSGLVASGEVARLQIIRDVNASGYWLPTTALVRAEKGLWSCFVLVKTGNNYRLEKRDLEILHANGDRVFVRGILSDGERVVSTGTQRLVPNQLVRPLAAIEIERTKQLAAKTNF